MVQTEQDTCLEKHCIDRFHSQSPREYEGHHQLVDDRHERKMMEHYKADSEQLKIRNA